MLACAKVLTLAAAFAPLLALDLVEIFVLTFVFVNVCDSEEVSDAVAAPVLAPALVAAPLAESAFVLARFLPGSELSFPFIEFLEKKNISSLILLFISSAVLL